MKSIRHGISITLLSFFALALFPMSSNAACTKKIDEAFEGRGYKDWQPVFDGGEISLGQGYEGQGLSITRSFAGGDQFTHLERELPQSWAGKTIKVEAMVRYKIIGGGRTFHHAGHIDLEVFDRNGKAQYPQWDQIVGSQTEWKQRFSTLLIPADAATIYFRIGLQGVVGQIDFDNIRIYLCD